MPAGIWSAMLHPRSCLELEGLQWLAGLTRSQLLDLSSGRGWGSEKLLDWWRENIQGLVSIVWRKGHEAQDFISRLMGRPTWGNKQYQAIIGTRAWMPAPKDTSKRAVAPSLPHHAVFIEYHTFCLVSGGPWTQFPQSYSPWNRLWFSRTTTYHYQLSHKTAIALDEVHWKHL